MMFHRPPDVVIGSPDNPYMERWHLIKPNKLFNIYLHKISRSDDDRALHDHRADNLSIILRGSYVEHIAVWPLRWDEADQLIEEVHRRGIGNIIYRRGDVPHRLVLPQGTNGREKPVWTLWIKFREWRTWGFWIGRHWMHWKDYINQFGSAEQKASNESYIKDGMKD